MLSVVQTLPHASLCCSGLPSGTNNLSIKTSVGAAAGRQQQQLAGQQRAGSALGKHGRDSGTLGDSAAKRMRRGSQPRSLPAAAGAASKGSASAIADKHLAVGCRVGVYWRLDKVFYRVSQQAISLASDVCVTASTVVQVLC